MRPALAPVPVVQPIISVSLSPSPQYYAECHGVIYVIDSTDEERLNESKQAFGGCSVVGEEGTGGHWVLLPPTLSSGPGRLIQGRMEGHGANSPPFREDGHK